MSTLKRQARVAGWWYLLLALTAPLAVAEVPIILWLAIWGARTPKTARSQDRP